MTPELSSKPNIRQRITVTSVLCALAIAATACSGSGTDDGAVVEIGEPAQTSVPSDIVPRAPGFEDLEFGDSLEEFHGTRTEAEPANITIPGFRSVDWEDLIPPGFSSDQVLERYRDRLAEADRGSPEIDAIYAEMNAEFDVASVNEELNNEAIQLAGFVAPLTYDDGDNIVEFLLVPYFGACVHVPPPPANQTVLITLADGESLSLEDSWGAVWVAGTLVTSTIDTSLATASYTMTGPEFGVYETQ